MAALRLTAETEIAKSRGVVLPLVGFMLLLSFHVQNASAENTLIKALMGVRENSIALQQQESILHDTNSSVEIARATLNPRVYLEVGAGAFSRKSELRSNRAFENNADKYNNIALSFTQTLWDARARQHAIEATEDRRLSEKSKLDYFEQQAFMNAIKLHYNLKHDRTALNIARRHLKIAMREAQLEAERFEYNEATATDLGLVRSYLGKIEEAHRSAELRLAKSTTQYKRETGLKPGDGFEEIDISALLPETAHSAIEQALRKHPLLKSNQHSSKEASHLVDQEKAKLAPKIYLDGYISRGEFPTHDYNEIASLGLRLEIPLFQDVSAIGRVSLRQEAEFRNQLKHQKDAQEIIESIEFIFSAITSAKASVRNAKEILANTSSAYESAVQERDYRLRSTPDMLEVHNLFFLAALQKLEEERKLEIAKFSLLFSIGQLSAFMSNQIVDSVPVPQPRVIMFDDRNRLAFENKRDSLDRWHGIRTEMSMTKPRRRKRSNLHNHDR